MTLVTILKEKEIITTIESKKYDAASISEKANAWEEIAKAYNAQDHAHRTKQQLVVLWRDMKAKAKKAYAMRKKSRNLTGGGPIEGNVPLPVQMVIDIIPNTILDPLTGINDSDAVLHENSKFLVTVIILDTSTWTIHFEISLQKRTQQPQALQHRASRKRKM